MRKYTTEKVEEMARTFAGSACTDLCDMLHDYARRLRQDAVASQRDPIKDPVSGDRAVAGRDEFLFVDEKNVYTTGSVAVWCAWMQRPGIQCIRRGEPKA